MSRYGIFGAYNPHGAGLYGGSDGEKKHVCGKCRGPLGGRDDCPNNVKAEQPLKHCSISACRGCCANGCHGCIDLETDLAHQRAREQDNE